MAALAEELNQAQSKIYEILSKNLGNNKEATPEDYLNAFKEIQDLGTISYEASARIQRAQQLLAVFSSVGELGLDYLEFAAKYEGSGSIPDLREGDHAIHVLQQMGKDGLERLLRIFETSSVREKKLSVAFAIASIDGGLSRLKEYINGIDQEPRNSAIIGILRYIFNQNMHFNHGKRQPLPAEFELFIEAVRFAPTETDPQVRVEGVRVLAWINRLSVEELAVAADDPVDRVRDQALHSIIRLGIDKSNAYIFVRFFEDGDGEISKSAIDTLEKFRMVKIDADAVALAIINEIVIRKSGRPKEFFNSQNTVAGIEPLFVINPRLYEFIFSSLCDLAFNDDNNISERALKVGRKLGTNHFLSLIRLKAEANPEKASKLLYVLGETGNLPSSTRSLADYTNNLKELEDESVSRWKEITKQSKINYWVRMSATIIFFVTSLSLIVFGIYLITASNDLVTKGAGVLISLITTIFGMLTEFWKASIDDIKSSHIQQAGVEAAYISFMSQNGQIRLVFSRAYEKGEISETQLQAFHGLAANNLELLTSTLMKLQEPRQATKN